LSQQDLLKRVVPQLDEAGIEYMLTGSVVSSLQGEPRATHDIDVVISIRGSAGDAARALKAASPEPEFYLDEEAARAAIVERGMFNLIETREGGKVDAGCSRTTPSIRAASRGATSRSSRVPGSPCPGRKTPSS
jgi:hypothetical protein